MIPAHLPRYCPYCQQQYYGAYFSSTLHWPSWKISEHGTEFAFLNVTAPAVRSSSSFYHRCEDLDGWMSTLKEGEMLLVRPSTVDFALVIQGFLHRSFYNLKINIFNNLISIIRANIPKSYAKYMSLLQKYEEELGIRVKIQINFACFAVICWESSPTSPLFCTSRLLTSAIVSSNIPYCSWKWYYRHETQRPAKCAFTEYTLHTCSCKNCTKHRSMGWLLSGNKTNFGDSLALFLLAYRRLFLSW